MGAAKKQLLVLVAFILLCAVGISTFFGDGFEHRRDLNTSKTADEVILPVNDSSRFEGNVTYGTFLNNDTQIEYNKSAPFKPKVFRQSSGNELFALRTLPSNYSSGSCPTSLEDFYPFDESGGKAWEYCSGHHGSYQSGVTQGVSSPVFNGYSFNGSSSGLVDIPDNSQFNAYTVVAWVKFTSNNDGNTDRVVSFEQNNAIFWNGDGAGGVDFRHRQSDKTFIDISTTAGNDKWLMLAHAWDGTNVYAYKNGSLIGSNSTDGTINSEGNGDAIGARQDGVVPFNGSVAEVRVYTSNLSQSKIQALYARDTILGPEVDRPDNFPPSITLNAPAANKTYSGGEATVTFNATVSDDNELENASLYTNESGS